MGGSRDSHTHLQSNGLAAGWMPHLYEGEPLGNHYSRRHRDHRDESSEDEDDEVSCCLPSPQAKISQRICSRWKVYKSEISRAEP